MIRTGEIVEKKGELSTVVFERPAACAHCDGCMGNQCTRIDLPTCAEVGDSVEVEMPAKNILSASAIAYLIPLFLLLLGLLLGGPVRAWLSLTMDANLFSAILGLSLLAIGLGIVRLMDQKLRKRPDWVPRVVAVHKKE